MTGRADLGCEVKSKQVSVTASKNNNLTGLLKSGQENCRRSIKVYLSLEFDMLYNLIIFTSKLHNPARHMHMYIFVWVINCFIYIIINSILRKYCWVSKKKNNALLLHENVFKKVFAWNHKIPTDRHMWRDLMREIEVRSGELREEIAYKGTL